MNRCTKPNHRAVAVAIACDFMNNPQSLVPFWALIAQKVILCSGDCMSGLACLITLGQILLFKVSYTSIVLRGQMVETHTPQFPF